MNCPSRTDNVDGHEGWNQNPNLLAGTTREDFNGRANSITLRRANLDTVDTLDGELSTCPGPDDLPSKGNNPEADPTGQLPREKALESHVISPTSVTMGAGASGFVFRGASDVFKKCQSVLITFGKFIGPGFMISVAYIDPGNYSTDVAAGASYQFKLLFIVLMSNIIAIYLQSLCIKLGTVTGMDLAQMCRASLPRWLNYFLYFMAEGAIIATDIAEVIGTAIAINLLIPQIPLVAGCAISICDVLLILLFYRPNGSMKGLRAFEIFVMALVLGVVVCFCVQLSLIRDTSIGEVFRGYLPSSAITEANGLYQACGILGATVMPHSLYLGSGIVQPRLLDYDVKHGLATKQKSNSEPKTRYKPSIPAIKFCLNYSIFELGISLFTFALFVNSAILIVAGASLSSTGDAEDASLFTIHDLLSNSLAPAAGTIFALALLLSGISAGIVCTIAGQMVSEGALNWTIKPWMRRLVTRSISITPSIIIAGAVGEAGLTAALNGSQVALSIALPFISAPIIWFTCRNRYMTVKSRRPVGVVVDYEDDQSAAGEPEGGAVEEGAVGEGDLKMRNHWITTSFAVVIWLVIAAMNVANIVLLALGK